MSLNTIIQEKVSHQPGSSGQESDSQESDQKHIPQGLFNSLYTKGASFMYYVTNKMKRSSAATKTFVGATALLSLLYGTTTAPSLPQDSSPRALTYSSAHNSRDVTCQNKSVSVSPQNTSSKKIVPPSSWCSATGQSETNHYILQERPGTKTEVGYKSDPTISQDQTLNSKHVVSEEALDMLLRPIVTAHSVKEGYQKTTVPEEVQQVIEPIKKVFLVNDKTPVDVLKVNEQQSSPQKDEGTAQQNTGVVKQVESIKSLYTTAKEKITDTEITGYFRNEAAVGKNGSAFLTNESEFAVNNIPLTDNTRLDILFRLGHGDNPSPSGGGTPGFGLHGVTRWYDEKPHQDFFASATFRTANLFSNVSDSLTTIHASYFEGGSPMRYGDCADPFDYDYVRTGGRSDFSGFHISAKHEFNLEDPGSYGFPDGALPRVFFGGLVEYAQGSDLFTPGTLTSVLTLDSIDSLRIGGTAGLKSGEYNISWFGALIPGAGDFEQRIVVEYFKEKPVVDVGEHASLRLIRGTLHHTVYDGKSNITPAIECIFHLENKTPDPVQHFLFAGIAAQYPHFFENIISPERVEAYIGVIGGTIPKDRLFENLIDNTHTFLGYIRASATRESTIFELGAAYNLFSGYITPKDLRLPESESTEWSLPVYITATKNFGSEDPLQLCFGGKIQLLHHVNDTVDIQAGLNVEKKFAISSFYPGLSLPYSLLSNSFKSSLTDDFSAMFEVVISYRGARPVRR